MAFTSGYVEINKIDYGPVENTLSWNSIEGVRFRLGGKTNMNFNKHLFFEGFLAYGTKDEKFKYQTKAMYSFADKKYNQWEFPLNLLTFTYEYNTNIPGQELLMGTPDRLFLSFNRGDIDKMTLNRTYSLEYEYETLSQFGINLKVQHLKQEPLANLNFTSSSAIFLIILETPDVETVIRLGDIPKPSSEVIFSMASVTASCTGSFCVKPTSDSNNLSVSIYLKKFPLTPVERIFLET